MRTRPLFTSIFALALLAHAASSQEGRFDALLDRLEAEMEAQHVPGMAIAIVENDEIVLVEGLGWADREKKERIQADTLFMAGSTTKAFTATLVATLVEEGKMSWDDPVHEHLPWFELAIDADADDEVTIRDLLCHRSGFTRMSMLWISDQVDEDTILRTAANAEPWTPFRKQFNYNNVMFLAAGTAAGAAADSTWHDLMDERLLGPLGMEHSTTRTSVAVDDEKLATGYSWNEDTGEFDVTESLDIDRIGPAGSLVSTATDMAQWIRFQLGRGTFENEALVSEALIDETWTTQIEMGAGASYGLGWMLRTWEERKVVEHGGNIAGFSAEVALLPEEDLGFVILCNVNMSAMQQTSIPIIFGALFATEEVAAAEAAAVEEEAFDEFLGNYIANFAAFDDVAFEVLVQNERLAVDIPGQMTFELLPPDEEGKRQFAFTDQISISFDRNEEGEVSCMKMYQSGLTFEIPREGVKSTAEPEIPLEDLQPYLGKFHHPLLGADIEFVIQNDRLAVDIPKQMVFELHAPDMDGVRRFRVSDELAIRFNEDGVTIDELTFIERGTETVLRRSSPAPVSDLPSVADILELRGLEQREKLLAEAGLFELVGTVRFAQSGIYGDISIVADPERYRMNMDMGPFGTIRVASDGNSAASYNSMQGRKELQGKQLAQVRLEHPAVNIGDWREHFEKVRVVREEFLDGQPVWVLKMKHAAFPTSTWYVSQETGDLLKAQSVLIEGSMQIPVTSTFEDFADLGGIRMPRRAISSNDASGHTIIELEKLRTNRTEKPGMFEVPAE